MKFKKRDIITGAVGLFLMGTTAAGFIGWYTEHQRAAGLENHIMELQLSEKRSAVVRSISRQMEEIAYQQKGISDEQREEAFHQQKVAEEMRQRSEVERQNALIAQEKALVSEQQAQDARLVAESERQTAEHQRIQAEFSKRVADTLSYIALGRSLASLSLVQARLGNTELSDLLSYASFHFINEYDGDLYYPSVFQSLMTSSHSMRTWTRHKGSVMALYFMPDSSNRIVTVSTYGEIMMHSNQGEQLQSKLLLGDKTYDFRDLFIDKDNTIYAVSRSGHLAIVENNTPHVITIENFSNPMALSELDSNSLLVIGDGGLAVYDKQRKMIVATRELDFHLTAASRYNNQPLLFDDKGRQHLVNNINELETAKVPVPGRVTAFASSKASKHQAYGMSDGTIYLYNEVTKKITKLEGHLSRISKISINNQRLLSSSYDGTVKFWNIGSTKIEPTTMISAESWIMNFRMDPSKQYVWIGNQNGDVMEALMSVPSMVDMTWDRLKRDFTAEEWNYYIGKNVPYESFLKKKETVKGEK